jgi:outer membrane protein W
MKKNKIIAAMLLCVAGAAYAQDNTTTTTTTTTTGSSSDAVDYAPVAGDFSGAILFGRGNFLNTGLDVPGQSNNWQSIPVTGSSPYANTVEPNDNSITNIVGGEVRYFLMDNIALKMSGGAILRNTPARPNIPGYTQGSDPAAWIPAYAAVQADNRLDVNVNVGGEYHFSTKYSRLFPYAGVTIPFYYAQRSIYNPTINDGSSSSPSSSPQIVDVGVRSVEIVGFGAQGVAGVDYYLMEGLYFGFEIKPISYVYAYSNKIPAPGLAALQADTHTWSFFSQTFFKVGFRF